MLPSYLAGATREGRRPVPRSEERPQRAGKEESPAGSAIAGPSRSRRSPDRGAEHGRDNSRYGLAASARNQGRARGRPGHVPIR